VAVADHLSSPTIFVARDRFGQLPHAQALRREPRKALTRRCGPPTNSAWLRRAVCRVARVSRSKALRRCGRPRIPPTQAASCEPPPISQTNDVGCRISIRCIDLVLCTAAEHAAGADLAMPAPLSVPRRQRIEARRIAWILLNHWNHSVSETFRTPLSLAFVQRARGKRVVGRTTYPRC
jgi:hypothetical protein